MDQIDSVVFASFGSPAGGHRPAIARSDRQAAGRAGGRYARRLVAIMYADVASYCRLTGADEDGTHARLSEYLDAIGAAIGHHEGEVSHYAGDAVLARFGTVTDAVTCALAIQRELGVRNAGLTHDRRVDFRIGINVGDVIADRADIFGNAVNVAARLQGLADPGGICVSEAVRAAVGSDVGAEFRFMGRRRVKNIAVPLRAYRLGERARSAGFAVRRPRIAVLLRAVRSVPSLAGAILARAAAKARPLSAPAAAVQGADR